MSGLPIATAPKTGQPVLLYWRGAGWMRGGYFVDEHFASRPRGWVSPEHGWRNDGDLLIPRNQKDCTHWMPLPPPPETQENKA